MVVNMEGGTKMMLLLLWQNRIEYNICSCDKLSVESLGQNQHDVCDHVHDIYYVCL